MYNNITVIHCSVTLIDHCLYITMQLITLRAIYNIYRRYMNKNKSKWDFNLCSNKDLLSRSVSEKKDVLSCSSYACDKKLHFLHTSIYEYNYFSYNFCIYIEKCGCMCVRVSVCACYWER